MTSYLRKFCLKKSKEFDWVEQKLNDLTRVSLEEKRKLYKCGKNFKTIDDVKRWGPNCNFGPQGEKLKQLRKIYELQENPIQKLQEPKELKEQSDQESGDSYSQASTLYFDYFEADPVLNNKIGIITGTIDTLEVDAVVVPCNQYFQSCKEYDKALPLPSSNAFTTDIIHVAAGPYLRKECDYLQACPIGAAKITGGYLLPSRFVIHTAAPTKDLPEEIETCYINSLCLAVEHGIKTIAFPCISAGGLYGIPPQEAAEKVLRIVRAFLEEHKQFFELIVFCLKDDSDIISYQDFLPYFFPLEKQDSGASS